jgi:hypothetical protein
MKVLINAVRSVGGRGKFQTVTIFYEISDR